MPLCDSSETCTRAVRPEPSPAVLRLTCTAGIPEVSRFSCMKFLGVSGVFDYAGPSRNSRLSPLFMLPSAHYQRPRRPACIFSKLDSPPHLFPCLRFAVHLAVPNAKL